MVCVYPTKEPDVAQKTITLREISKRLDGLEILISRIADRSEASVRNVAGGGDAMIVVVKRFRLNLLQIPVNVYQTIAQHGIYY